MKKVAILQSNYIPWKGYFDIINSVDTFIIYDEVQYTKNDWRNRNQINSKQGLQWITIPVRVQSLDQKICETKVSFPKWNKKHWNTIVTNYGKSPNFKKYKGRFESLYLEMETDLLSEINLQFIKSINEVLGIDTEIIDSRELDLSGDKNERLIDAVKKVGGELYLSGPAAKSYLDESLFSEEGVIVEWQSYQGYPDYYSIHNNFSHNISIIDLLFCSEEVNKKMITTI